MAAGYIWLLGLWLLLSQSIIGADGPRELFGRITQLADWGGKTASFAAISFGAYIAGTVSIALTRGIKRLVAPLKTTRLGWLIPRYWIDRMLEESLDEAVESRISEQFMEDPSFRKVIVDHVLNCRTRARLERRTLIALIADLPDVSRLEHEALKDEFVRWRLITAAVDGFEYVESAKKDIGHLAYRLLGKEEQVYGEYDRFRSEGTFRLGLAIPLVFLCCVLAATDSIWWIFGLVMPVALAYLGGGSFAEAENTLAAAVASGRVELPSLEKIPVKDVRLSPYKDLLRDDTPTVAAPLYSLRAMAWFRRRA